MGNIVSILSQSPFAGTWIDDTRSPHELVIKAEGSKLAISSKWIPEEGVIIDNPDEEIHGEVTHATKDTLDYVTYCASTGWRTNRTLMATKDRNLLLGKITYSDTTPATKLEASAERPGIYGSWQPTNDDFWSEYCFSMDGQQLRVRAFDRGDDVECIVANIESGEDWISFETETPSDGRQAQLKFIFDANGANAIMHFTFTEFYRLRRIR